MAEAPNTALPYEADHGNVRADLEGNWQVPEAGKGVRSPV